MKASKFKSFSKNSYITLHNQEFLENQRIAGKIAADAISLLENEVKNKTTKTLIELDKLAEEFIRDNNCLPTFLGYKNFPNCCCISVNKQLVHGIPTNYQLQDGDLVSFDLGATYGNPAAIADTAMTMIFGLSRSEKYTKLVAATKEALDTAIGVITVGKRLGVIGETIMTIGRKYGYSVVDRYGGHGISCSDDGKIGIPHSSPFVNNIDSSNNGPRIQVGQVLAIEPLFVLGESNETIISLDGWTVETKNISAHFEHTIFVHKDNIEIITKR